MVDSLNNLLLEELQQQQQDSSASSSSGASCRNHAFAFHWAQQRLDVTQQPSSPSSLSPPRPSPPAFSCFPCGDLAPASLLSLPMPQHLPSEEERAAPLDYYDSPLLLFFGENDSGALQQELRGVTLFALQVLASS